MGTNGCCRRSSATCARSSLDLIARELSFREATEQLLGLGNEGALTLRLLLEPGCDPASLFLAAATAASGGAQPATRVWVSVSWQG
jgi:hypothetical protein